jgi:hypothetical protein
MRTSTIGIVVISALVLGGCGGGAHFANKARSATPVDLTVYINDARVSVSPNTVGAGPVIFIITNQSSKTQTVNFQSTGGGSSLASSAPINPQATTELTVDLNNPGDYNLTTTAPTAGTDAAQATAASIQPATLHIGPPRPNANGVLLQP